MSTRIYDCLKCIGEKIIENKDLLTDLEIHLSVFCAYGGAVLRQHNAWAFIVTSKNDRC